MHNTISELCKEIPLPHLSQAYLLLLFLIPTSIIKQIQSAGWTVRCHYTPVDMSNVVLP